MTKKKEVREAEKAQENFEEQLDRLRAIVRSLEQGDISLENSLQKFEEGMVLAKTCQERLSQAERKIEILIKADASGMVTEEFQSGS